VSHNIFLDLWIGGSKTVSHNGEMQLTILHGFKAKSKEAQARKIQSVWPLEDLKSLCSETSSVALNLDGVWSI
jgi:hypothetical protein